MSKPPTNIDDIMHQAAAHQDRVDMYAAQILVIDEMLARLSGPDPRESLERPGIKHGSFLKRPFSKVGQLTGTGHQTITLTDGSTVAVLVTECAGEYIAQALDHDEGWPSVSRSTPREALADLREALEARS